MSFSESEPLSPPWYVEHLSEEDFIILSYITEVFLEESPDGLSTYDEIAPAVALFKLPGLGVALAQTGHTLRRVSQKDRVKKDKEIVQLMKEMVADLLRISLKVTPDFGAYGAQLTISVLTEPTTESDPGVRVLEYRNPDEPPWQRELFTE